MNCPNCLMPQFCPCASCQATHGQEITWIWAKNGEDIFCCFCGFSMHADGWNEASWDKICDNMSDTTAVGWE